MAEISKVRFGGVDYDIKSITDTSLSEAGTPADAAAVGAVRSNTMPLTGATPYATAIPENSDLNDYTSIGNYRVGSSSAARTISNIPVAFGGRLIVFGLTGQTANNQLYVTTTARVFIRSYNTFTFGDWKEITNRASQDVVESISRDVDILKTETSDMAHMDELRYEGYISDGYSNANLSDNVRSVIYHNDGHYLQFKYNAILDRTQNINPSVRPSTQFSIDSTQEPYILHVDFTKHPYLLIKRTFNAPNDVDYSDALQMYVYNANETKAIRITPNMIPDSGVIDIWQILYNNVGDSEVDTYTALAIMGVYGNTVSTDTGSVTLIYDVYGIIYAEDVIEGLTLSSLVDNQIEQNNNIDIFSKDCWLYRNSIPSYYFEKEENPINYSADEYIEGKIASIPYGKHFIFVTDTHWDPLAHDGRFTSSHQSTQLIQYIRKRIGISKVVFGGDILNRAGTKYIGNMWLKAYINDLRSAFGNDLIYCHGNHDMNTANIDSISDMTLEEAYEQYMIPYKQTYHSCFKPFNGNICYDTNYYSFGTISNSEDLEEMMYYNKHHFYVDDVENKVRYISLYTGCALNGIVRTYTNTYAYGETLLQVPWLYEVLKSIPEGYDVVCVGHQMLSPTEHKAISNSTSIPIKLLAARRAKTSFSYNFPARGVYYSSGTQSFDFTNLPDIGKVILVTGHYHVDNDVIFKIDSNGDMLELDPDGIAIENGVLGVITQNDAYGQTAAKSWPMSLNTISEVCFDIITYNDKGVYLTRIGAGEDRSYTY